MRHRLAKKKQCTGCGACVDNCHHGALHITYDKNGFLRPEQNNQKCIECGACERACPILNIAKLPFSDAQKLRHYAAWSNLEEVCQNSSSGGVFSQIAMNLLSSKDNVVVFGAEATKQNTCHHQSIVNVKELLRITGTKYIQSNAEGSYREAKKYLQEGRKVFYCGTPCQIAGLYATLGYKNHPNLYTADLICHGVPSKIGADIVTAYVGGEYIHSYRDKQEGWCKPGLIKVSQKTTYSMPDGKLYRPEKNLFWQCFAITHRVSCTQCPFANPYRLGDVSLGDLWGLYKQYPERGKLGASLVLANTAKGEMMLNSGEITKIEHDKAELTCYTIFYPGASRWGQLSEWLYLLKKLPIHTACHILLLDWRKNPLLIPIKVLFRIASNLHIKHTMSAILNTKRNLGWQ